LRQLGPVRDSWRLPKERARRAPIRRHAALEHLGVASGHAPSPRRRYPRIHRRPQFEILTHRRAVAGTGARPPPAHGPERHGDAVLGLLTRDFATALAGAALLADECDIDPDGSAALA